MTAAEMRRLMLHKVVPEEVLPQNIIGLLIDDDAELPEMDAFTFLTRLRALGIGSADFLYLLEGCGAPEEAVEKIRGNPAMNLQGLILTLENSGMTPDDYSRMLYTARQIWEQTLTMRLERTEKISAPDYSDNTVDSDEYGGGDYEESDDDFEEFDEPSFTEVFDHVVDVVSGNKPAAPSQQDDVKIYGGRTSEDESEAYDNAEVYEESGDEEEPYSAQFDEDAEVYGESADNRESESLEDYEDTDTYQESQACEEPEAPASTGGYSGDTTQIVNISPELIRQHLSKLSDKEEEQEDSEDIGESENQKPHNKSRYHKRALVAGALGAVVLVGCAAAAGVYFTSAGGSVAYARNESDIFSDIYDAYYAGIAGGENVCAYSADYNEVFADLLVHGEGLGVFSEGSYIYNVDCEMITANVFDNGSITTVGELLPPEQSQFVAAFDGGAGLIALYSGKQSGFMKISDGKADFTVYQDGVLTDYSAENGELTLATVYTPTFTHTFTTQDTDVYLPKFGLDEPQPISPQNVIKSGTTGYSYAVNVTYETSGGTVKSSAAVLGNPIYADASGQCVLNGEYGLIVSITDNPQSEKCGEITAAAFFEQGCAVIEDGAVIIRDKDYKAVPQAVSFTETPTELSFSGNILIISGENGVILTLDCSDINNTKIVELKQVEGAVSGAEAIAFETDIFGVSLTRYISDNGKASAIAGAVNSDIGQDKLATVEFGGVNSAVFGNGLGGAAYSYFDGVSVVSEYVVFGSEQKTLTLYDDKTGFKFAFENGGRIYAVSSGGASDILESAPNNT